MEFKPKRLIKTMLASALALSSVATATVTMAQNYDELISDAIVQIEGLTAAQEELYAELQASYEEIEELQEQSKELSDAIVVDKKALSELEEEIKVLEEIIQNRESLLQEQARAVQVSSGSANYLNYVASSKSVTDLVGRVDVINTMISSNKDLIDLQLADKAEVEAKRVEASQKLEEQEAKREELEKSKADLAKRTVEREAAYEQLTNDITLAAEQRDMLVSERAFYEEQQRIAREQAIYEEQLALANQQALEASIAAAGQAQSDAELQAQYEQALREAEAQDAAIAQAQAEAEAAAQAEAEALARAEAAEQAALEAEQNANNVYVPEVVVPEVQPEVESDIYIEETVEPDLVVPEETPTWEEVTEEDYVEEPTWEEAVEPEVPSWEEANQAELEAQERARQEAEWAAQEAERLRQEAEQARLEAEAAAEANRTAQSKVQQMISFAEQFIGTPYVWGGKTPAGFDCSGFVQYVFLNTYGIDLGGWTGAQQNAGTRISVSEAQAGDLYFWSDGGNTTYHVAIATGDGNYIHASQPGTPLEYNRVSQYFMPSFALRINK